MLGAVCTNRYKYTEYLIPQTLNVNSSYQGRGQGGVGSGQLTGGQ